METWIVNEMNMNISSLVCTADKIQMSDLDASLETNSEFLHPIPNGTPRDTQDTGCF